MCGFLTVYLRTGQLDIHDVDVWRDSMHHRGPDDAGTWMRDDGRLALAHRRLSILDLSPLGHQPMVDPTGKLHIVFNGEIYNHMDIRNELTDTWDFRSRSDTETILAAYRKWGESLLDHLQGMFAFIIYDAEADCLFAARDRAGEKPFFYRSHSGGFEAASELKALIEVPFFPRSIEPSAFNCYLTLGYIPGDACILNGVNKLPAAHALRYSLETGMLKVWCYWHVPAPDPLTDETVLLDTIESLLESSVRRQLVADVPVGVLLSGGVDSSLITALAARTSGKQVRTFTIAFPGQGNYDESKFAHQVAEYFNTDHTELVAEPATVNLLPILARQYDEPMCDSSMVPTYLVSQLARQCCTVVLGGDGGDELFGGYTSYQWALKQANIRYCIPALLRRVVSACADRLWPVGVRGRDFALGLAGTLEHALAGNAPLFDLRNRMLISPLLHEAGQLSDPSEFKLRLYDSSRGLPGAAMVMDFGSYLSEDILVKVDRAGMLNSLEIRSPFLDQRIIEFAFAKVPNNLRTNQHGRKLILKRLARKLLPSELDIDRKQGLTLPLSKWYAGQWGKYMEDVLMEAPPHLFVPSAINTLINDQRRGRVNAERIFSLVLFELWRREYDISI